MKIRNTGARPTVAGAAGVKPVERVEPAKPSRPVAQSNDVATVMGIPEAELTPKVREALSQLMAEVHHLRGELDRAKKRVEYLEQLADQDSLTPVMNRRAFVRELTRMTAFVERYGASGSVLYFDINDMKQVNDRYGHGAGDAALMHVAEVLLRHVRASDIVGRLGGDEFAVILAQSDPEAAARKAAHLASEIQESPAIFDGQEINVHVAVGVHDLAAGDGAAEALHAADKAMYQHKRSTTETAEKATGSG